MNIEKIYEIIEHDKKLTKEQLFLVRKSPIHQQCLIWEKACEVQALNLAKELFKMCSIKPENIQKATLKALLEQRHHNTDMLEWLFSFKPDIKLDIQHRSLIDNTPEVLTIAFMNLPISQKFIYHLINYALQHKNEDSLNWLMEHQQKKMIPYHADMYYFALHSMYQNKVYVNPEELEPMPKLFINIFDLLDTDYGIMMDRLIGRKNPLHDHPNIQLLHEAAFAQHINQLYSRYLHQRLLKATQPKDNEEKTIKRRLKV